MLNKLILTSKTSAMILLAVSILVLLSVIIGLTCNVIASNINNPIFHVIGLDAIGLLAAVYTVDRFNS
jgi:hypothetical protein